MAALWAGLAKGAPLPWKPFGDEETTLVIDAVEPNGSFVTEAGVRSGVCTALDEVGIGPRNFIKLTTALAACTGSQVRRMGLLVR